MNDEIKIGYASTGTGTLIRHFWKWDKQFQFYVSLCGTKITKHVSDSSDGVRTCKSCQRSRQVRQ